MNIFFKKQDVKNGNLIILLIIMFFIDFTTNAQLIEKFNLSCNLPSSDKFEKCLKEKMDSLITGKEIVIIGTETKYQSDIIYVLSEYLLNEKGFDVLLNSDYYFGMFNNVNSIRNDSFCRDYIERNKQTLISENFLDFVSNNFANTEKSIYGIGLPYFDNLELLIENIKLKSNFEKEEYNSFLLDTFIKVFLIETTSNLKHDSIIAWNDYLIRQFELDKNYYCIQQLVNIKYWIELDKIIKSNPYKGRLDTINKVFNEMYIFNIQLIKERLYPNKKLIVLLPNNSAVYQAEATTNNSKNTSQILKENYGNKVMNIIPFVMENKLSVYEKGKKTETHKLPRPRLKQKSFEKQLSKKIHLYGLINFNFKNKNSSIRYKNYLFVQNERQATSISKRVDLMIYIKYSEIVKVKF